MFRVTWAGPVLADLRGVYDFIAGDSRRYAQLTVEKIRAAAQRLADFPEIGHVLPEFPDGPYRQVLMGGYRVIYRLEKKTSSSSNYGSSSWRERSSPDLNKAIVRA